MELYSLDKMRVRKIEEKIKSLLPVEYQDTFEHMLNYNYSQGHDHGVDQTIKQIEESFWGKLLNEKIRGISDRDR